MTTLKRIGNFLLIASLCATTSVLAAPLASECGEPVPLARLIANPDAYHGKALWVVAEVTIEFENMTACPSKQVTQDRYKNCLWLTIDDGPHNTDQDYARYQSKLKTWERFNLQTVAIRATFDKSLKGHFSMWPGGLRNVSEMLGHEGGWNFTTNKAMPRSACVDKFQLPKQPDDQRAMISGNLKLRNKDINGAIADFSRAISINPSNGGYYLTRAGAKGKNRDYIGAIADYTSAIERMPEDRDSIYIFRADMKEKNGDLDGAIADYTRAIEIGPKEADTYRRRGLARQKKGDAQGAAADLARAKQLAPVPSTP
jgi:tetratricopeptide (TPR) repeat protein